MKSVKDRRNIIILAIFSCIAMTLGGCATQEHFRLTAGQTITLAAGQTVEAQSPATIAIPNGNTYTFKSTFKDIKVPAGTIVSVAGNASGPVNNTVSAFAADQGGNVAQNGFVAVPNPEAVEKRGRGENETTHGAALV